MGRPEPGDLARAHAERFDECWCRSLCWWQDGGLHAVIRDAEPCATPRETSASIAQWQNETFGAADLTMDRFERSYERMQEAMDAVRDMDWFPTRPNLSRALRAAEELAELIELLVADDSDPKAPREVADIDIVLRGIDAYHGVERSDQVDAKMAINRARKWDLTGDGHGQHVKEDE